MQLVSGEEIWWSGEKVRLLFVDEHGVYGEFCESSRRFAKKRSDLDRALLEGAVCSYFEMDRKQRSADWYHGLSESEQTALTKKVCFAEYFARNRVSVEGQNDVIRRIATQHDVIKIPGASSVRRWASKYKSSGFDPHSLLKLSRG